MPKWRLSRGNHPSSAVPRYARKSSSGWPAPVISCSRPDGVHKVTVVEPPELKGRQFETPYRSGVPDGRFRAFYADGRLWGEAMYQKGRLAGRHRVFSPTGEVVFETDFAL